MVRSRDGNYNITTEDLDTYLVPKSGEKVTREHVHETGRGVAYTRTEFAYLFTRTR